MTGLATKRKGGTHVATYSSRGVGLHAGLPGNLRLGFGPSALTRG